MRAHFVSLRMVAKMLMHHDFSPVDKIGLIAGNGNLPEEVIKSYIDLGRRIFVIFLEGSGDEPESLKDVPHIKLSIGSVGKAIRTLRGEGIKNIIMAGAIKRPKLSELKLDAGGIKLLAKISAAKLSGDNSLLVTVIKFFESSGFSVLGVDEVLSSALMPRGNLGKIEPHKNSYTDIHLGMEVARIIGNLDVGQGVVVQGGVVLGVEAIEGTDALLERCKHLKLEGPGGVLVKMKKPNQDSRIDLPTIGMNTIVNAHKAGLRGIAIEAGSALIVEKNKVIETANRLGLFVSGV